MLISSSEVDVSSSCFSVVGHGINSITVLSSFTSELKTRAFLFSDTINTCWRVSTTVNTCAVGIDPLCTEQVNKIYVYFLKARLVSVVMVTRRGRGLDNIGHLCSSFDVPRRKEAINKFNEGIIKDSQLTCRQGAGPTVQGQRVQYVT